jgi:hypothetical protein
MLPRDMHRALDRIRDGLTSIVSGDAMTHLGDDLSVREELLPFQIQLNGELAKVLKPQHMFN